MKRRARYTPKKNKIHKCDACGYVSPSLKDYKHHVEFNPKCRQKLPYSCHFCSYVGYDHRQFDKHLQGRPFCKQSYKEREVATGQILDLSSGNLPFNAASPNMTSYEFQHVIFWHNK